MNRPGMILFPTDFSRCAGQALVSALDLAASNDATLRLSLSPYPEQYVTQGVMADGTEVLLRPIKPEDEPMWLELLEACSKESIYSRFGFFFDWSTQENATRFCHIDYDREMAIVAELLEAGKRKLLGVGRLVADPDVENVEYAVLVGDRWQNRGLGGLLTDHCLDIARRWGVRHIYAQTKFDNPRMIQVFRSRDFRIERDTNGSDVDVGMYLG